jgi:uncharacterized membrane protein YphA (DoxX/SURF4 family)
MGLVVVRIALGVFFLFEGIDKIGWFADSDLLTETLKGWLSEAPSLSRTYLEDVAIPAAPVFARLVPLGELGFGIALLLGFRTRLAAVLAFLMVLNFHFASGALFRYSFLNQRVRPSRAGGTRGALRPLGPASLESGLSQTTYNPLLQEVRRVAS